MLSGIRQSKDQLAVVAVVVSRLVSRGIEAISGMLTVLD